MKLNLANCSFVASTHIYQYRNRLMHYTLNSTFKQIIKDAAEAMNEVAEFVENEIMKYLPEEAQEEFKNSIDNYRKYAKVLRNEYSIYGKSDA